MSIFKETVMSDGDDLSLSDSFVESCICAEFNALCDDDRKAFMESAECEALIQEGLITKKTLVRLSKNDDLSRRTKMAAFELAKKNGDALWDKLKKNRIMEKKLIAAIVQKYGTKSTNIAKKSQKEYIKTNKTAFKPSSGIIR